jgi:hypothetical protein
MEALKDLLELVRRYPRSVVGHRDLEEAVTRACGDLHPAAAAGVSHGVAHEVPQYLGESVGVRLERAIHRPQFEVTLAKQGKIATEVIEEVGQVDSTPCDDLARLRAGQREHVTDQPVELVQPPQQCHGALVSASLVGLSIEQFDLHAQDT